MTTWKGLNFLPLHMNLHITFFREITDIRRRDSKTVDAKEIVGLSRLSLLSSVCIQFLAVLLL